MDTSDTDEHLSVEDDSRWFISTAVNSHAASYDSAGGAMRHGSRGAKSRPSNSSTSRRVSWSASPHKKIKARSVEYIEEAAPLDVAGSLEGSKDGHGAFIDLDLLKPRLRPKAEKVRDYRKLVYSRKRGRRLFLYFTAFPVYFPWWLTKVRMHFLVIFNCLYACQLAITALYFYPDAHRVFPSLTVVDVRKVVHPFEVLLPLLLLTFDGILLGYTATKMPIMTTHEGRAKAANARVNSAKKEEEREQRSGKGGGNQPGIGRHEGHEEAHEPAEFGRNNVDSGKEGEEKRREEEEEEEGEGDGDGDGMKGAEEEEEDEEEENADADVDEDDRDGKFARDSLSASGGSPPRTPRIPQRSVSSGRSLMTIDCCSASDMELDSSESEEEADSTLSWGRNEIKTAQDDAPLVGHIKRVINPKNEKRYSETRRRRRMPVKLTVEDIRDAIEAKVHEASPDTFYMHIGAAVSFLTALMPTIYRAYHHSAPVVERVSMITGWEIAPTGDKCMVDEAWYDREPLWDVASNFKEAVFGSSIMCLLVIGCCFCSTLTLSWIYFNSVTLAEETFRKRFLYAKYFSKLTSLGKARQSKLPHFRLNKISNIRIWLALRSRGAEINRNYSNRAGDATANLVVIVTLSFVVIVGIKILYSKDHADVFRTLDEWVLLLWTTTLLFYIVRFSNLAKKTVKKLNPQALLMTEILNLQMLVSYKKMISPERLEEYQAALSTLKVLVKAIRAIDSKKDSYQKAILLNPVVYSILRITVLSAVGTITSKSLGFKVRLWKL